MTGVRKNTAAVFAAVIMLLSLAGIFAAETVYADGWNMYYLEDIEDVLTDEEETKVRDLLSRTVSEVDCCVGLVFTDDLRGKTSREYAEQCFDSAFGADANGVLLVISGDIGNSDWLTAEGEAEKLYGAHSDKLLTACYEGLNRGGFYGLAESYCGYLTENSGGSAVIPEYSSYQIVLVDYDGVLSSDEISALESYMQATADKIKCNVGVVIAADIGGRSEVDYADDFLDSSFGYGSNSIVLLINNDTYVDRISTCGDAQDMYNSRVNSIFSYIDSDLKNENFCQAITDFCTYLQNHTGGGGNSYTVSEPISNDLNVFDYIAVLFIPTVIALILSISITCGVMAGYKKKKPVSAASYLETNRTKYRVKNDIFLREFTTHHTVSSSSSGGHHSGGGGHHSSSHHSHGGGSHHR